MTVFGDCANQTDVSSIVTPEGYECAYGDLGEAPQGIAELGGDAFERTGCNESWFKSTTDSPDSKTAKTSAKHDHLT